MKCFILVLSVLSASALPDGIGHNHGRGGRQLDTGYGSPDLAAASAPAAYGAPSERDESLATYGDDSLSNYNDNSLVAEASEREEEVAGSPIDMLMKAVPGTPGEDYPIYSEAPETSFVCDGQINGGYYADSEAECQVFHICSDDGAGGLAKYSFLCPNGTIFNQEYFICDWWFNVDCSQAEALAEARNAEIASEREAASSRLAEDNLDAAGSAPIGSYGVLDTAASEALSNYDSGLPGYNGERK